jgi:DNA-binding GntR family transcriptional regulator
MSRMSSRPSPRDLVQAARGGRRLYPDGHYAVIRSAQLHPAPEHVAHALDVMPGTAVIRREREHRDADGELLSVSVSWFVAGLEEEGCVRLLECERIPEGTPNYIAAVTGLAVVRGRDWVTTVEADQEQAAMMGVAVGSPAQHVLTYWVDADGDTVELGESLAGPGQSIIYDYTV